MEMERSAREQQGHPADRAHARVFVVRVWKSDAPEQPEYRGTVRDVAGGAWRSFRDWSDAATFMMARFEDEDDPDPGRTGGTI
jgi:hypothetical protein